MKDEFLIEMFWHITIRFSRYKSATAHALVE
jgi:hypothetical protein